MNSEFGIYNESQWGNWKTSVERLNILLWTSFLAMRDIVIFSKSADSLNFFHFTLKYLFPNYFYNCFLFHLQLYKFLSLTKGGKGKEEESYVNLNKLIKLGKKIIKLILRVLYQLDCIYLPLLHKISTWLHDSKSCVIFIENKSY